MVRTIIIKGDEVGMSRTQLNKLCCLSKVWAGRALRGTVTVLLGLNITGCNILQPTTSKTPPHNSCEAQQHEIDRLRQQLAEKEEVIRNLNVRQQDQVKALQETNSQVARDQIRFRRLATQPAAASAIAETEVAMATLKLPQVTVSEQTLQAQRLLDAASAAYAKENYGMAMDHAAQAQEFIGMVKDNRSHKASDLRFAVVPFNIAIPMRAKGNIILRREPFGSAAKIVTIKKDSVLTAQAYLGDWLHVQTGDEHSGWVLNTLVDVRVGDPEH